MMEAAPPSVYLVAADTDWASARLAKAHRKIELGGAPVIGLGCGGHPDWAQRCAEACAGVLREALTRADQCWIMAGMGGGTGSGAAPVVARLASEAGAVVRALVTLPLILEGPRRSRVAAEGLDALSSQVHAVHTLPLEDFLVKTGRKISLAEYYSKAERELCARVLSLLGS